MPIKVVLLDFWAEWCPPCQQMLPHERKLVDDFKDEPFVLLGVFLNSPTKLQALVDAQEVTWRNWVDGRAGSIGDRWRIDAIPTVFVLDHEGVIRHKATGLVEVEQLRQWVEELLAELNNGSG